MPTNDPAEPNRHEGDRWDEKVPDPFDVDDSLEPQRELGTAQDPIAAQLVDAAGQSDSVSPSLVEEYRYIPPRRLRWWTTLAVPAVSLIVFFAASLFMTVLAFAIVHGEISQELLANPEALQSVTESRVGLFCLVVIPQFALVLPSVAAALLSPVETRRRLGLVRGHWPIWAWIAAAAATPLIGLVSSVVIGQFMEESENLKMMTEIFRKHGQSGFLIPLALMIGATPAICEELLFRGYVQTRLTRAFTPAIGIVLASFLFAVFHMDFVHIVAVFPLGLFLGYITWRSGSLFPGMIGHFVNNVISVVAVVLAPQDNLDVLAIPAAIVSLSIIGLGIIGMTAVVTASIQFGRPPEHALAGEAATLPFV